MNKILKGLLIAILSMVVIYFAICLIVLIFSILRSNI